jgi:hypothetical protein
MSVLEGGGREGGREEGRMGGWEDGRMGGRERMGGWEDRRTEGREGGKEQEAIPSMTKTLLREEVPDFFNMSEARTMVFNAVSHPIE